jgi:hypothetical protein
MGSVEEELGSVWKRLTVKIQSEEPSAKCPFSYIIMEKGGYWVGVLFIFVKIFYHGN